MRHPAYRSGAYDSDADLHILMADTITCHDADDDTFSGLYDADGMPLHRARERVRMGFHRD